VTVTVTPTPTTPPGPATSIDPGIYLVKTDIAPGTYKTAGAIGSNCYYARLKGTSGSLDDIITNGNSTGQTIVTIASTDVAFQTSGCQTWKKIG
jgi:hypothetical protein